MNRKKVLFSGIFILLLTISTGIGYNIELGPAIQIPAPTPSLDKSQELSTTQGLTVDIQNRSDVASFYQTVYLASQGISANWNGNVDNCVPGTTIQAYEDATLLRVNYYRAMAGLPADIVFNDTFDTQCQEAALMMIKQGALSHTPGTDWGCYTAEGATAAGNSNLALGSHGPDAIDGYMEDPGASNNRVGHRNWILFPRQKIMGSGSTDARNGFYFGSNSLWVIDSATWIPRPSSPEWIAWPPPGYVPFQVVYPRWSFSYAGADFENATVAMTREGSPVNVVKEYGDFRTNTLPDSILVWVPDGFPISSPGEDIAYTVTLSNVVINGVPREFGYQVTIIDPDQVVVEPTPTPTIPPVPPIALRIQEVFDMSMNWQRDPYFGISDLTNDGKVNENDLFYAIKHWPD